MPEDLVVLGQQVWLTFTQFIVGHPLSGLCVKFSAQKSKLSPVAKITLGIWILNLLPLSLEPPSGRQTITHMIPIMTGNTTCPRYVPTSEMVTWAGIRPRRHNWPLEAVNTTVTLPVPWHCSTCSINFAISSDCHQRLLPSKQLDRSQGWQCFTWSGELHFGTFNTS